MNRLKLSIVLILCAIITSIIGRVFFPESPDRNTRNKARIFVLFVAYKHSSWINVLVDMMRAATYPERVSIGVVEFVQKARDSLETQVPMNMHSAIHVFTVSTRTARHLQHARNMCLKRLYNDEEYVFMINDSILSIGWDEMLCNMVDDKSVITTRPIDNRARYSALSRYGKVRYKKMKMESHEAVPGLVWSPEFSFSTAHIAIEICRKHTMWEVSEHLMRSGAAILEPTQLIAQPIESTQLRMKQNEADFKSFWEYAKYEERKHNISIGLSVHPSSEEKIAKFGSTVAARIAVQDQMSVE